MNVSLTPQLERFIKKRVKSGRYQNASELIRASVRMLQDYEEFRDDVRREIEISLDQVAKGEVVDGPSFMAELKKKYAKYEEPPE